MNSAHDSKSHSPPADTIRPNRADILEVIREIATDLSQTKPDIHEDTRLDKFFSEHCDEDLDPLMLWFEIEAALGVRLDQDDWFFLSGEKLTRNANEWRLRFAPLFTFGRLADLVHKRMPTERIEPLTILGSTSKAAGAFRWMEWCATKVKTDVKRFGPSTPIVERFRGRRLEEFWRRCRAVSGGRLPKLRESPGLRFTKRMPLGWMTLAVLIGTIVITLVLTLQETQDFLTSLKAAFTYGLCLSMPLLIAFALLIVVLHLIVNLFAPTQAVLPFDISTFADIARIIAGERGGWCTKCDYELTGIQSDRCPECGTTRTWWERSSLQTLPDVPQSTQTSNINS